LNPSSDPEHFYSHSYSHFRRVGGLIRHARVYPGPVKQSVTSDALLPVEGQPIVIVPGLGCASWMYSRLARQLAAERTVWVYDHPGMGLSKGHRPGPARIEELTNDLAAWLSARDVAGVPLLGHSLGGEVVIDLAARYPHLPGPLIMCAPTGIPENPGTLAQIVRLLLNVPRERLGLIPLALAAYLRTGPFRMLHLITDQYRHETGPLISQVRSPALVVDGSADPVIRSWTLDVMCRELPLARACTIEGGTHALIDSRAVQVAHETLRFLRDVENGDFTNEC
jgi:pimeloyl-ACP methyl ester carboxylesterase